MNTIEFNKMIYDEVNVEDRKFNINDVKANVEIDSKTGKVINPTLDENG